MPLDNSFDDSFKRLCIGWQLKFCLLPKKCFYSKKTIWFKKAYFGTAMLTGPGDPLFHHRWVDQKEFFLQQIKGTI